MPAPAPTSILLVNTTLSIGGAQRFASTLLQHLDRARVRPALCLLRGDVGFPLPGDVTPHQLGYRQLWHLPRTVDRLRRLIDETRPDVLLSVLLAANLVSGLALRLCEHRPAWVARNASNPARDDGWRALFARWIYRRADRVVVNSRRLVETMVRCYPSTEGRIDVLANPTDFAAIDRVADEPPEHVKPAGVPLLIAVGRLGREKRLDLLIDAFRRVRERYPALLWICGEGPCRGAILRQIDRLGLADSVRLLGFCSNPYALMRQADIFVLSSDYEGLPNALIEAQGLGLPAVSTQCPHGPDEIIAGGRSGLLTPVGDAGALAAAISEILSDPTRRRRMAAAARELSRERFAATPLTRAWEALLLRQARRKMETAGGREVPYSDG